MQKENYMRKKLCEGMIIQGGNYTEKEQYWGRDNIREKTYRLESIKRKKTEQRELYRKKTILSKKTKKEENYTRKRLYREKNIKREGTRKRIKK